MDNNFVCNLHNKDPELDERKDVKKIRAELCYYISVQSQNEFVVSSEVGWISKSKLILTINNEYYLLNLIHNDLVKAKNQVKYGK